MGDAQGGAVAMAGGSSRRGTASNVRGGRRDGQGNGRGGGARGKGHRRSHSNSKRNRSPKGPRPMPSPYVPSLRVPTDGDHSHHPDFSGNFAPLLSCGSNDENGPIPEDPALLKSEVMRLRQIVWENARQFEAERQRLEDIAHKAFDAADMWKARCRNVVSQDVAALVRTLLGGFPFRQLVREGNVLASISQHSGFAAPTVSEMTERKLLLCSDLVVLWNPLTGVCDCAMLITCRLQTGGPREFFLVSDNGLTVFHVMCSPGAEAEYSTWLHDLRHCIDMAVAQAYSAMHESVLPALNMNADTETSSYRTESDIEFPAPSRPQGHIANKLEEDAEIQELGQLLVPEDLSEASDGIDESAMVDIRVEQTEDGEETAVVLVVVYTRGRHWRAGSSATTISTPPRTAS